MATDLLLVKEGNRLAAADPISAETLEAMKQGEIVTATVRRARNGKHFRKFFALLKVVYDNQERYATPETLLDAVKFEVGLYDLYTLPGKVPVQIVKLRSISFAKMSQTEFSASMTVWCGG